MTVSKKLKRLCLVSFSALYGGGLAYWLSRLFLRHAGSFGEEQHWLEKSAGPFHLVAAVTFIFVTGIIWARHAEYAVKLGKHRFSGWVFFAVLAFMLVTGVTQLYGNEYWIHRAEQLHPWFGVALLPILAIHWLKKKRIARHSRGWRI